MLATRSSGAEARLRLAGGRGSRESARSEELDDRVPTSDAEFQLLRVTMRRMAMWRQGVPSCRWRA